MIACNSMVRRTAFILLTVLFMFTSCKDKKYSNAQLKAFSTFNGNYHSYVDRDGEMIFAVISFLYHYSKPRQVKSGNKVLFYAHGECFFSDYQYYIPDEGYITCYYSLSYEANSISFYYKGGGNNNQLLRKYGLLIENDDTFILMDNDRRLVFEKVK
ncbi:MAG: hypothetical protein LBE13_15135 [Bacteroidales bacterium]|jgi:hypothetical protein|nr:hypothetical protein [Bacteroidales bacterium]